MSFMFHPYPYKDPQAINRISVSDEVRAARVSGIQAVAKVLVEKALQGGGLAIDLYPGAPIDQLAQVMRMAASGTELEFVDAKSLLLRPQEISALLEPYLPVDREIDPVLLYGRRFKNGYDSLQDAAKVQALLDKIASGAPVVVYGQGALAEKIAEKVAQRYWMDVTPRTAVLSYKNGKAQNLGAEKALPYNLMMRRNYYVDFEIAVERRWSMIRNGELDGYITADEPEKMTMFPFEAVISLFEELNRRPFRCCPVYLEGVWGGYYVKRLRSLPDAMRNCAWVFDMIPMEVSLVADAGDFQWEVPFFTFVQTMGEKLLGRQAVEQFGGYFPIRFNYDDTYHSSGNMSIQCHPDANYVITNHGELGRQDESYYVVVAGQGARTFLGFEGKDSCEVFLKEAHRAEKTGEIIDYEKYIHAVKSTPGTQVMIPAGTVHASGRNQVILEIGSLTVGSYTYKLYDYQRLDITTGKPRPIHLKMGEAVLHGERDTEYVNANLVNHGGLVREGDGWREIIVGEHELLYFSLRNLIFDHQIEDQTGGLFHVLALVDGEKVRVESIADPSLYYEMNLLDIAVIPAHLGAYRIINLGVGTVTVHKTHLKREEA